MRQLEKSLLQALNEVKGRILDDDTIITTLENLKKEAAEVTRKVEETDIVMQEVETVSQQYLSLSSACSSIYFTMESLNQVSTLLFRAKRKRHPLPFQGGGFGHVLKYLPTEKQVK